jgi:hypothetical protein
MSLLTTHPKETVKDLQHLLECPHIDAQEHQLVEGYIRKDRLDQSQTSYLGQHPCLPLGEAVRNPVHHRLEGSHRQPMQGKRYANVLYQ